MGSRLVVDVRKGSKIICTVYYHWSASTAGAYEELRNLTSILEEDAYYNPVDAIIRGLSKRGGGLDPDERGFVKSAWGHDVSDDFIACDRSEGIVNLSPRGMSDKLAWAEGFASINVDDKTCINYVFDEYSSWQEMKKLYESNDYDWDPDWTPEHFETMKGIQWLGEEVPWNCLNQAIQELGDDLEWKRQDGALCFYTSM